MNNIGENIHKQVIDTGLLPTLVKIVKKKVCSSLFLDVTSLQFRELSYLFQFVYYLFHQSDLPVRERIFLLLDATQTSLGGASGKFPQYYTAYFDLVVSLKQERNYVVLFSKKRSQIRLRELFFLLSSVTSRTQELNFLRDQILHHQLWSLHKRFREIHLMNNLHLLEMMCLQLLSSENLKLPLPLGIFFSA